MKWFWLFSSVGALQLQRIRVCVAGALFIYPAYAANDTEQIPPPGSIIEATLVVDSQFTDNHHSSLLRGQANQIITIVIRCQRAHRHSLHSSVKQQNENNIKLKSHSSDGIKRETRQLKSAGSSE